MNKYWDVPVPTYKTLQLAVPQRCRPHAVRHQSKESLLHLSETKTWLIKSKPMKAIWAFAAKKIAPAALYQRWPVWSFWAWHHSNCDSSWNSCKCRCQDLLLQGAPWGTWHMYRHLRKTQSELVTKLRACVRVIHSYVGFIECRCMSSCSVVLMIPIAHVLQKFKLPEQPQRHSVSATLTLCYKQFGYRSAAESGAVVDRNDAHRQS